jgi:hypothetical protein
VHHSVTSKSEGLPLFEELRRSNADIQLVQWNIASQVQEINRELAAVPEGRHFFYFLCLDDEGNQTSAHILSTHLLDDLLFRMWGNSCFVFHAASNPLSCALQ